MLKRMGKIRKVQLSDIQIQLVAFFLFLIIGSIYANGTIPNNREQYNLVFDFFYNKIDGSSVSKIDLFEFILFSRLKLLIVLWLIGFVLFAKYLDIIVSGYFGFSTGFVFSAALISKGISHYFFVLLLHFPHYLIYIPVFMYIVYSNIRFSKLLYKNRKMSKMIKFNGQMVFEYFLVCIIASLIMAIGVFLEAFVNVDLIKWFIGLDS